MKIFTHIIALMLISFPFIALGDSSGIVQCDNCEWEDFVSTARRLMIELVKYGLLFSVIVFIWAGFKLLFSGGSESEITAARKMITKVVIGFLIAVSSFLIVYTIMTALGVNKADFIKFSP